MLAAVAPIAGAVELPVTADMEAGYGDEPEAAAATARGVVEVGAVGLNLEDTERRRRRAAAPDRALRRQDRRRARGGDRDRRSARAQRPHRCLPRPDRRPGDPARACRRARPRVSRGRRRLHLRPRRRRPGRDHGARAGHRRAGQRPRRAGLTAADRACKALGVARISTGSGPYRAALALARRMAEEAYGQGSLDSMIAAQVAFADAQALFPAVDATEGETDGRKLSIVRRGRSTEEGPDVVRRSTSIREPGRPARPRARGDRQGRRRPGARRRPAARRGARAGPRPDRGPARERQDAARPGDGARARREVQAHPVHARHDARRDHRRQHDRRWASRSSCPASSSRTSSSPTRSTARRRAPRPRCSRRCRSAPSRSKASRISCPTRSS